jgi:hypothetical protein
MGDWLVGHFTVFGVPGLNWMLIALAIVLLSMPFVGGVKPVDERE